MNVSDRKKLAADDPRWGHVIDWPYRKVTLVVTTTTELGTEMVRTAEVDVVEGGGIRVPLGRGFVSVQVVGHSAPVNQGGEQK